MAMWAKYKFYLIAAGLVIVGIIAYRRYSKKSAIQQEVKDPASKVVSSGSTIGDTVALSRALNFVR